MFEALKAFKEKEGRWPCHSEADKREVVYPDGLMEMRDLATWIAIQRSAKKDSGSMKMTDERERILNSIGFVWEPYEEQWDAMFEAVKAFKEKEGRWPGHGKKEDKREVVYPDGSMEMRDLAPWISKQRRVKKGVRGMKMTDKRERMLNSIGFA